MTSPAATAALLAAAAGWLATPGHADALQRVTGRRDITAQQAAPGPFLLAGALSITLTALAGIAGARVWVLVAGGLLVASAVAVLVRRWRTDRARTARERAVIELCDALGAELRAGLPVATAVPRACDGHPDWAPVARAARLGGDVSAAARMCAVRPGAEGLRAVAAAWAVAGRSGAALADVLDRVASALRSEEEARAEVVAALGPPRATAKMLAVLPLAGLGLGVLMGAHPVLFLFGSTAGLACLAAGTTLALAGVVWVEHLAHAVEE